MKVLIAGATGFIGSEVLSQLLANPKVTSVVALSRRPLPETTAKHPKLQTVIQPDFSSWPADTTSRFADADACIWALGVAMANMETQRKVNYEYTYAAAKAFTNDITPKTQEKGEKRFRFVYTSGIMAERDQGKTLWFGGAARRLRGEVETSLLDLAKREPNLATFVVRPGGVRAKKQGVIGGLVGSLGTGLSIRVDELAATMIDLAINDVESSKCIWDNAEMVDSGRKLLVK